MCVVRVNFELTYFIQFRDKINVISIGCDLVWVVVCTAYIEGIVCYETGVVLGTAITRMIVVLTHIPQISKLHTYHCTHCGIC